jgi:hypothetical protein
VLALAAPIAVFLFLCFAIGVIIAQIESEHARLREQRTDNDRVVH